MRLTRSCSSIGVLSRRLQQVAGDKGPAASLGTSAVSLATSIIWAAIVVIDVVIITPGPPSAWVAVEPLQQELDGNRLLHEIKPQVSSRLGACQGHIPVGHVVAVVGDDRLPAPQISGAKQQRRPLGTAIQQVEGHLADGRRVQVDLGDCSLVVSIPEAEPRPVLQLDVVEHGA